MLGWRDGTLIGLAAVFVGGVLLGRYWRPMDRKWLTLFAVVASILGAWVLFINRPDPMLFLEHGLSGWYGPAINNALYSFSAFFFIPLIVPWGPVAARLAVALAVFGGSILYGIHVYGNDVITNDPRVSMLLDQTGWALSILVTMMTVGFKIARRYVRAVT